MLSEETVTTSMICVRATTAAPTTSSTAPSVTSHRAPLQRRIRVSRRGMDWVVHINGSGRQANTELMHHVVVLMHEVVAVHHVLADLFAERAAGVGAAELDDHPDLFSRADIHDVLRPEFVRERRLSVAAENLEVDEMDV